MYDARRKLHSEAHQAEPDWPIIPMSSMIERMAVLRCPVGATAPRSDPARAVQKLWAGIERKLVSG
jgi:hypothetical protein